MSSELHVHRQFVKDVKRLKKAGWDMRKLKSFLQELRKSPPFPEQYSVHPLQGDLQGVWDAHITQNWVVLFRRVQPGIIELLRTGTHGYLNIS